MGVFSWIRQSVKAAFLGGVQDALDELRAAPAEAPVVHLQLEHREAEPLPAVEMARPSRNGRAART